MPYNPAEADLDFNIYVDPSCLSTPMDEETSATMPASPGEVQEPTAVAETADAPAAQDESGDVEQLSQDAASGAIGEAQESSASEAEAAPAINDATEVQMDDNNAQQEPVIEEQQDNTGDEFAVDEPRADAEDTAEVTVAADEAPAPEPCAATDSTVEKAASEPEPVEAPTSNEPELVDETGSSEPKPVKESEPKDTAEPASETAPPEPEIEAASEPAPVDVSATEIPSEQAEQDGRPDEARPAEIEQEPAANAEPQPTDDGPTEGSRGAEPDQGQHEESQDYATPEMEGTHQQATETAADEEEHERPRSTIGERKTSLRTEALIHAAARAVIAKIEKRKSGEPADGEDEPDNSLLSAASQDTYTLGDDTQPVLGDRPTASRRQSGESQVRHAPSRSMSSDDTGESSSPHEPDDDVFSDRSARSSVYSLDGHDHHGDMRTRTPQAKDQHPSLSRRDSYASSSGMTHLLSHSPRAVSSFSTISGFSQYDKEPFVPTSRDTRMPFRTPSEIRAIQMASPTPSVFGGSSPRSAKRRSVGGGGGGVSAQYSPKGRSTPPRFKAAARKEAPLVLLHVTLLPLRWVWGEVLNGLDAVAQVQGTSGAKVAGVPTGLDEVGESPLPFEPSEQLKGLRDAWRELQDRVGDTVLERGILLPHPQNDYEVLEERLLEALELPVRRRARILECGHYLGPANMTSLEEEDDDESSEDEDGERRDQQKKHWCRTCRDEIRYEQLCPGRVFRVKVYASNGLMKAGAWDACWKEMERVDVEVEPIVDSAVQAELERLGALQLELEEHRRLALERERTPDPDAERAPTRQHTELASEREFAQLERMASPTPSGMQLSLHGSSSQPRPSSTSLVRAATPTTYSVDTSEDRRRRDEERMREIYGEVPQAPAPAPVPAQLPAPPPGPVEQQPPQQQQTQLYQPLAAPTPPPMPMAMPMLTDGSALQHRHPHHHGDPYSGHANTYNATTQPEDPYRNARQEPNPRTDQKRRPAVDENSSFVELLMEAFKVLLRDPKNVAIIVLCVFLVVLMKSPVMRGEAAQNQVVQVASPAPNYQYERRQPEVAEAQVQVSSQVDGVPGPKGDSAAGYGQQVESAVPVEEVVAQVMASAGFPVAEHEAAVVADDLAAPNLPQIGEDVDIAHEVPVLEREQKTPGTEDVDAQPAEDASAMVAETLDFLTDTCPPRALAYPMTMADEIPMLSEEEIVHDMESSLASADFAGTTSSGTVEDFDAELPGATVEKDDPAGEECTTPTSSDGEDAEDLPKVDQEDAAKRCNAESDADTEGDEHQDDVDPTASADAAASSPSDFLPGPFVTERRTVRVFETVTETVRVSVVTQTETVSTVVTAVPQTVEETVYETETVRITVSVPVEEQKKAKARGTKGCKSQGKGWF